MYVGGRGLGSGGGEVEDFVNFSNKIYFMAQ